MALSKLDKINYANVALIFISCIVAIIFPFELFLIAYAILGPLHYLTEISWLHNKQYYTKKKYDYSVLVVLSLLIAIPVLGLLFHFRTAFSNTDINNFMYLGVASSVIFVFVKNPFYRILSFILALILLRFSGNFYLLLSVFLPTLIHVFVFTALFVLYGALKTKSKSGYISFWTMVLVPVILIYAFSGVGHDTISSYCLKAYKNFEGINFYSLKQFSDLNATTSESIHQGIYFSKPGIILMRFIAFAYTYHYLNWFSKTEVIQWHKVPKQRLLIIFILWTLSVVSYGLDYQLGFQCLFFLSFLHVLLELPLNIISIKGIITELFYSHKKQISTK